LPKEIFFGVKDLLKKVQYDWWPPEEFKNNLAGRFDLYPEDFVDMTRDEIISYVEKHEIIKNPDYR